MKAQNEELLSRDYTYNTLSPYLKKLLDTFLLDEMPIEENLSNILSDQTSIRSKTRLAQALLLEMRLETQKRLFIF